MGRVSVSSRATWATVALKSPAEAKSRLRSFCSAGEVRSLYFLMARKVLLALRAVPAIERLLVVTASDELVGFVGELGCQVIRQPQDLGTRSAFAHARAYIELQAVRPARLLMISGDLPLITPEAVGDLLEQQAHRGVAIVPDVRLQGTNGLVCSPPEAVPLCFGKDSLRRHCSAALARGHHLQVVESGALSLDIDDHHDLNLLRGRLKAQPKLDAGLTSWLDRHALRTENADFE